MLKLWFPTLILGALLQLEISSASRSSSKEKRKAKDQSSNVCFSSGTCIAEITRFRVPESDIEIIFPESVTHLKHRGFDLWMNCSRRSAQYFYYQAVPDTGNLPRKKSFIFDPNVDKSCQQTSTKSYSSGYDRGHLVPANHFDHDEVAIKQTNYITNILPQAEKMNRGAWLQTEEIIECQRDIETLWVFGGPIWSSSSDRLNSYEKPSTSLLTSHSIEVPVSFWKVIVSTNRTLSYIIPNNEYSTYSRLDDYLKTISEVEQKSGIVFNYGAAKRSWKTSKVSKSWSIPKNCDKG